MGNGGNMKKSASRLYFLLVLVAALGLIVQPSFGERGTQPPKDPTIATKDLSSVNLPATYGAAANEYFTDALGKLNICVINGASTKIYGTTSATSTCTSGTNKFAIPANGSVCIEFVKLLKYVCLRSSSGTLSSGVIDAWIW